MLRRTLIILCLGFFAFTLVAPALTLAADTKAEQKDKPANGKNKYEGTILPKKGTTFTDTCEAGSSGEAKRIFEARYPDAIVNQVRKIN